MAKKISNKHICSGCIGEFDAKDLFEALVISQFGPTCNYYTLFCDKCVKVLDYKDATPYYKPRAKKVVTVEFDENGEPVTQKITKKPTTKKPTTKKPTTKKPTTKKPTTKKPLKNEK